MTFENPHIAESNRLLREINRLLKAIRTHLADFTKRVDVDRWIQEARQLNEQRRASRLLSIEFAEDSDSTVTLEATQEAVTESMVETDYLNLQQHLDRLASKLNLSRRRESRNPHLAESIRLGRAADDLTEHIKASWLVLSAYQSIREWVFAARAVNEQLRSVRLRAIAWAEEHGATIQLKSGTLLTREGVASLHAARLQYLKTCAEHAGCLKLLARLGGTIKSVDAEYAAIEHDLVVELNEGDPAFLLQQVKECRDLVDRWRRHCQSLLKSAAAPILPHVKFWPATKEDLFSEFVARLTVLHRHETAVRLRADTAPLPDSKLRHIPFTSEVSPPHDDPKHVDVEYIGPDGRYVGFKQRLADKDAIDFGEVVKKFRDEMKRKNAD